MRISSGLSKLNMSIPSLSRSPGRRVPVQERSERRVATFVGHIADLIAEVGYEAATMTEIAERAGTSIGAVYQYFPNKEAMVLALRERYSMEMDLEWSKMEADLDRLDAAALSARIVTQMVDFAGKRPAFFSLLNAPAACQLAPAWRRRKLRRFASMFQAKNPSLSDEEAERMAKVIFQTIKGLYTLLGEAPHKERGKVEAEYRALVTAYLRSRLEPARARRGERRSSKRPRANAPRALAKRGQTPPL
jgi:AcrR family transcriptional regulator